jgi:hypothetical protein
MHEYRICNNDIETRGLTRQKIIFRYDDIILRDQAIVMWVACIGTIEGGVAKA